MDIEEEDLHKVWSINTGKDHNEIDNQLQLIHNETAITFPETNVKKRGKYSKKHDNMYIERSLFSHQVGTNPLGPDGTKNETYYQTIFHYETILYKQKSLMGYGIAHQVLGGVSFLLFIILIAIGWSANKYTVPAYTDFYEWNASAGAFLNPQKCSSKLNVIAMMGFVLFFTGVFLVVEGTFYVIAHKKLTTQFLYEDIKTSKKPVSKEEGVVKMNAYNKWASETSSGKGSPFRLTETTFFWDSIRDSGVNLFRWINYSLSTGMFIWVISLVAGVSNITQMVLLWGLTIIFFSCWFASEYQFNFHAPLEMITGEEADNGEYGLNIKDTEGFEFVDAKFHERFAGELQAAVTEFNTYSKEEVAHHSRGSKWVGFTLTLFFGLLTYAIVMVYFIANIQSNHTKSPWIVKATWAVTMIFFLGMLIVYILRYPIKFFRVNPLAYEMIIKSIDIAMKIIVAFMITAAGHQDDFLGFGINC